MSRSLWIGVVELTNWYIVGIPKEGDIGSKSISPIVVILVLSTTVIERRQPGFNFFQLTGLSVDLPSLISSMIKDVPRSLAQV